MAFVQGASTAYSTGSPYTNAFGSNNTAGNMLIAQFNGVGTGPATISDTIGNTGWTPLFSGAPDSGQLAAIWYCFNCKAGANTISVAAANCPTLGGVAIAEFSGGLNALDSNSNTTFNDTPPPTYAGTTVPVVTQFANETLIGFFIVAQGYSAVGSGFTVGEGISYSGTYYPIFEYQVGVAAGSWTASITSGSNAGDIYGLLAAFYVASGPPPTNKLLGLLGVGT